MWQEVLTVIVALSNVMYAFFRIADFFGKRRNREVEALREQRQVETDNKLTSILSYLTSSNDYKG
jgi:hypothetical protein